MVTDNTSFLQQALENVRQNQPKRIFIVGATASGKSDFAIELAVALKSDGHKTAIINADSYARYKQMDIGTAKVSREQRDGLKERYGIKHFQIDVLEPTGESTAHEFATSAIIDIKKTELPIICGGSGLYVRALSDGFTFQKRDVVLRAKLEQRVKNDGCTALYTELQKLSCDAAKATDPNNARRIIRALEAIYTTGQFTPELPEYIYVEPETLQLGIDLPRAQLDARIEARTKKMQELGLEDEVRRLYEGGLLGKTAAKAIGYAEFVQYFEGAANPANGKPLTRDAVYEMIDNHTKRLVRRQQSWFKRDPRIVWMYK